MGAVNGHATVADGGTGLRGRNMTAYGNRKTELGL
jgi:hypothetical protein